MPCTSLVRWPMTILALVILACVGCAHPKPLDPSNAVVPWSHERQSAEPYQPPFLARFEKGDENLSFVAASHGCDPRTFGLIDDVLAAHPVRMVVVEGFSNAEGVNAPMYSQRFPEWEAGGFCHGGGEGAYAAVHAAVHGASFVAGEPEERAVVQAVLKDGYTVEDLLGFYFVRQIPQFQREGTLEAKGLDECFRLVMLGMGKKAHLEDASGHFSLDRFRDWYRKRQGKTFDLATVDREETAPLPSGTLFTQRLSAVTGLVRDRFMVRVVADHLAAEKDILVVFGGSHFATQRPALELLLGKPVEMKAGRGLLPEPKEAER